MLCLPVYVLYKMIWQLRVEDYPPLECDVVYILAGFSLHSEAIESQNFATLKTYFTECPAI